VLKRLRFADNDGEAFCPHCGCATVYTLAETPIRWKCAGCRKKFSITSGTIFHSRKLSIRDYLAVIALFCNGVKGVAALRLSRDMNTSESAFVLLHKLRETMVPRCPMASCPAPWKSTGVFQQARLAPTNRKAEHVDRRTVAVERRQVVVVARERPWPRPALVWP